MSGIASSTATTSSGSWCVMPDLIHIPKGGMCAVCVNKFEDCSSLPFKEYRELERTNEIDGAFGVSQVFTVVRCQEWTRG